MGYERYPRNTNSQGDYYGRDFSGGRDSGDSRARDYDAGGGNEDDRRRGYGGREYGNDRYAQREQSGRGGDYYSGHNYGAQNYGGQNDATQSQGRRYGADGDYRGSYGSDGRRFEDAGRYRHADDDNYRGPSGQRDRGGYGRQPQGYDYDDRGFMARAGDEVRSWFGDEEAERRREADSRYEEGNDGDRDTDYHSWRRGQISALDRDYHEYRQENRTKFQNEFATWRSARQTQRDSLGKVAEHMDVVGSDGEHVGTVDKVRGDRILLTKNDADAGGHHHSIPSRWIDTVDTKVTLAKSAAEAKKAWRDEEDSQAMFGYGDRTASGAVSSDASAQAGGRDNQGRVLNRSFSGTYDRQR